MFYNEYRVPRPRRISGQPRYNNILCEQQWKNNKQTIKKYDSEYL